MTGYVYEWDEAKSASNQARHGLGFTALRDFEWDNTVVFPDRRKAYGEDRFIAYGLLKGRLHAVVFTPRGHARRIISLRKANRREQATYTSRD